MKSYFKIFEKVKNQAGVSAVIVAIVLTMLIGLSALAVDVGYMYATKNELQNVADAAALAATRKLGTIYQGMAYDAQQAYVCGTGNDDIAVIKDVANTVANKNKAGGKYMIVYGMTEKGVSIDDVEIGVWDPDNIPSPSENFTNYYQPDAVRVKVRRDSATQRSISTFFAKIFIDTVNVSAYATAALTGQSTNEPGELELPIAISNLAIEECNDPIRFSPTQDSCAGWTSFLLGANTPNIQDIITGDELSPGLTIGDPINFIGGELSDGTFNELLLLFKDRGYDVMVGGYDDDGNEILVPAYTDSEGYPITGHLDPLNYPNVLPLYLTDFDDGSLILDDEGLPIQLYYPEAGPPYKDETLRNRHLWPTKVVVYYEEEPPPDDETAECGNPNQSMIVDGFATILFTDVVGPPHKIVIGELLCDQYSNDDTRGGGGEHGTKGTIPGLVE